MPDLKRNSLPASVQSLHDKVDHQYDHYAEVLTDEEHELLSAILLQLKLLRKVVNDG